MVHQIGPLTLELKKDAPVVHKKTQKNEKINDQITGLVLKFEMYKILTGQKIAQKY